MAHHAGAVERTKSPIFLSPKELRVDKEALALEVMDEYTRVVKRYGHRSAQARAFLRRHRNLRRELKPLITLAQLFYEARRLGVL